MDMVQIDEHVNKSINLGKVLDDIFIISSIIFNILVGILYVTTKSGNMALVQFVGIIVLILIIPFTITLIGYIKEKEEKKIVISLVIILFYFFLEILFDYILILPFRDILALHIPYIVVFYMLPQNLVIWLLCSSLVLLSLF